MVAPQARRRADRAAREETVVLDPEGTSVSLLDDDDVDDVYLVEDDDVIDELDDIDMLDELEDDDEVAATSARYVRVAPVEATFIDLDDEDVDAPPPSMPARPSAVRALDPEIADLIGWFVHELSHAPRRPKPVSRVSAAMPIARGRVSASTPSAGRGPTRR